MAKKPEAKSATETQRRRVGKKNSDAGNQKSDSLCVSVPLRQRPSALLDTRVVYCGDNLEQLAKPNIFMLDYFACSYLWVLGF